MSEPNPAQSTPAPAGEATNTTNNATPQKTEQRPGNARAAADYEGDSGIIVAGKKGISEADLNKAAGAARADGESKGRKKLLEDLGFTDESELSGLIQAAKEREEAEKTEAQRISEQFEKLQSKHSKTETRAQELENKAKQTALTSAAQLAALEVGVRADRAADLIRLADLNGIEVSETDTGFNPNMETLKEALSSVLGRYPEWQARGPQNVGDSGAGAPVSEQTSSAPDFASMSAEEFAPWLEKAKNYGIPLPDLK